MKAPLLVLNAGSSSVKFSIFETTSDHAPSDDPHAKEAVDLFVYRIGREMGSLAAALKGVDAVIFTGGIGENASAIRARVCQDARWLGLELDEAANACNAPLLSTAASRVSAWVVPIDENLMIARHTRSLLEHQEAS